MNLRSLILGLPTSGALWGTIAPVAAQCDPPPPVKLMAPDPQPNQLFGGAVAISGDLMAIGAPRDDEAGKDAGAVYLYVREAGAWAFQEKLLAPGGQGGFKPGSLFGGAVDLKGHLLVVGAPEADDRTGAVYIFRQEGDSWKQEKAVFGSAGLKSYFGDAVAVDADAPDALLVVGEPKFPGVGAAYLYRRGEGGSWSPEATLTALDAAADDRFGWSVDVEADVAVVGAFEHRMNQMPLGAVYVFRDTGLGWVQEQELMAPDGFAWQNFGVSVSLSLPLVLVGTDAYDEVHNEYLPGGAYVFADTDAGWQEEAKIESPVGPDDFEFGSSVDLSEGLALVGAPNDLAAYSFARTSPGEWNLFQTFGPDDPKSSSFGSSCSMSGGTALFGDPLNMYQDGYLGAAFVAELCPAPCYSDFDADGTLTLFDFLAFVNAFSGADARADCDGSGVLDLFDFLCFVNAFNEGCG